MADVYALSLDGVDHRYVGATTQPIHRRLTNHKQNALKPYRRGVAPVYDWMREVGPENVIAVLLDRVSDDVIHKAEAGWISRLREEGHDLLNVQTGGPGMPGVPFSGSAASEKRSEYVTGRSRGPYRWVDKSRQADSGGKAAHNRWHRDRNTASSTCKFCTLT